MKFPGILAFLLLSAAFEGTTQPSFDVRHYDIRLDLSDIGSEAFTGRCAVNLEANSSGLQQIQLSLLKLQIDSVRLGSASLNFNHDDTTITITLPTALNTGDTTEIEIYYHGQPATDASWGGFYFSGGYAFNIGVAFTSNPHTFGRVWFPCIDNFTDKATYEMRVTTAASDKAFCSGLLQGSTGNPDGTVTWHWRMNQEIPTYLASVAVAGYASLEGKFASISGDSVPYILAAMPADTAKLRSSFIHLPDAFEGFESCYGEHGFDRVGFVVVPFSGGAMEHATNIAYPRFAITGGLQYETLMAHEFSHHWWGDLVTCKTAEDMWLNEGWASYSESIFLEKVYGKESYKQGVRENHKSVLQYTHISDDGYRAVSGVPHDYTYGSTVYDKGADVAHTLRGYMGDTLFFVCLKNYLDAFKYGNASSHDFRDFVSQCSGIDLTPFFDNWVFNPGFPHFSVDSFFTIQNSGDFDVTVFIRQRLKAAPSLYSNVPLELTFVSENFDSTTKTVLFSGGCGIYHTTLNFEPGFIAIDFREKISDAITDNYDNISAAGTYTFDEAMMTLTVTQAPSSALVRVEHNWIAPDPIRTSVPGLHISNERYWKVDGIIPSGFIASARIVYDGTAANGYLDRELITNSEDSLVIMFRPDASNDWSLYPDFDINTQGNANNKTGQITINNIKKGEYALGIRDSGRAVSDTQVVNSPCLVLDANDLPAEQSALNFNVFPNPADDSFFIKFERPLPNDSKITILDLSGKKMQEFILPGGVDKLYVTANNRSKTAYLIMMEDASGRMAKKVMMLD